MCMPFPETLVSVYVSGISFVSFSAFALNDCYISDSNNTNLGSLADYIAKHWKSLQKADRYTILEKYYSEETL